MSDENKTSMSRPPEMEDDGSVAEDAETVGSGVGLFPWSWKGWLVIAVVYLFALANTTRNATTGTEVLLGAVVLAVLFYAIARVVWKSRYGTPDT
jgi:hypothetical protein